MVMTDLDYDTEQLTRFLEANPRVVVLSGAGISASSGIPTYRDSAGVWQHSKPVTHQEFLQDAARRQRYWARSMAGWPTIRDARPGAGHRALSELERAGNLSLLITQNVDRLHQRAGSQQVIDLHGRLDRVSCLDCGTFYDRETIQQLLFRDNDSPSYNGTSARPDGDADLPDDYVDSFTAPSCKNCCGLLMPDVVFFGGTVPKPRVASCMDAIEQCDALIAIGSSLQVYSGFRFCRQVIASGKPLAIINPGSTRADDLATLKICQDCGPLLQRVATAYTSESVTL
jgi:NAD-dependent SIR2 family protein deacetylase